MFSVAAAATAFGPRKTKQRLQSKNSIPTLDQFVERRDYAGALALLEFKRKAGDDSVEDVDAWIAYCATRIGEYDRALVALERAHGAGDMGDEALTYMGICHLYLHDYDAASKCAAGAPPSALRNRLQFITAVRRNDEERFFRYHERLEEGPVDKLCLASAMDLRRKHQAAIDLCKQLLHDDNEALALQVYIALCYYKLDFFDVSIEMLDAYLRAHPDSIAAVNLRACNTCRLSNGRNAEQELRVLVQRGVDLRANPVLLHNLVVFRDGADAMQVLPRLLDNVREARSNLIVYNLRNEQVREAQALVEDLNGDDRHERCLRAIVHAIIGQLDGTPEDLRIARDDFNTVGSSEVARDTIEGRQCMASCFFLEGNFAEVVLYLSSIKDYMVKHDAFAWDYGIALAAEGKFEEAEDMLTKVESDVLRREEVFLTWLARCHILTGKARFAWQLYDKIGSTAERTTVLALLEVIANDSYRMGTFYYAAKAFEVLNKIDPSRDRVEGLCGACVGVFQQVVAQEEETQSLDDVVDILRELETTMESVQARYIRSVIRTWCRDNGVHLLSSSDEFQ